MDIDSSAIYTTTIYLFYSIQFGDDLFVVFSILLSFYYCFSNFLVFCIFVFTFYRFFLFIYIYVQRWWRHHSMIRQSSSSSATRSCSDGCVGDGVTVRCITAVMEVVNVGGCGKTRAVIAASASGWSACVGGGDHSFVIVLG